MNNEYEKIISGYQSKSNNENKKQKNISLEDIDQDNVLTPKKEEETDIFEASVRFSNRGTETLLKDICDISFHLINRLGENPIETFHTFIKGSFNKFTNFLSDKLCDKMGIMYLDMSEWINETYGKMDLTSLDKICKDMRWVNSDWTKVTDDVQWISATNDRKLKKYSGEYNNKIAIFQTDSLYEKERYVLIRFLNFKFKTPVYFDIELDAHEQFESECEKMAENWKKKTV